MLAIHLLLALLFVRAGLAALDQIVCHDDLRQTIAVNAGVGTTLNERIVSLAERAFQPGVSPGTRARLASFLSHNENYPPTLARLYATPQPLEHPMTAAECLEVLSLIPDSSSYVDPHNPGTHTRLNLAYPDTQRQRILQYRLDTILVAGNCAVQILRRPGQDPATDGLRHADTSAMALTVYPHARDKALDVIRQCLSGEGGQQQHRFGYVGTRSVLNGLAMDYVVAVTLWLGDPSLTNPGAHFYNQYGEMQAPNHGAPGYAGPVSFPFGHAFN
ncbi:hypothetical protein MMC26_005231 [Xylographa opegraphella]|nr:hypothetical protein [Xylographa opegraphella]